MQSRSIVRQGCIGGLLFVSLGLVLAGCEKPKSEAKAAPPPPPQVTVSQALRRMVADEAEFVGRFVAVDTVEMRARVSGYLEKIHFRDGQTVEKGQLLFTIDRRPFEATLAQVRANVEQARANLSFAESNLERGQNLKRGTVISEQTLDQRVQAERVAKSAVAAQEAALSQAQLDLQYTELRAPVSGRIGDRRVAPGNLVTGGTNGSTTLLATIQSTDPIRFEFTLDEASYLKFIRAYGDTAVSKPSVAVRLKLIDEQTFSREGHVDFVDNAIDRSSGVIRMRAEFSNPDGKLTPGMFGRIRLVMAPPASALLVPDTAIGTEQVRKFVLVVDDKNVAQPKYVTLGPVVDGLRVVRDGLAEGDRVVINGLMRARPGTKVAPKEGSIAFAADQAEPTGAKPN
ncbi:MAG: efflux RND transporter periplasmic adaptor subunit [Hyphomicrobiaceae bacterium]|nr:efflux RND transporter periplasmic adaptor subunit [Hyphomicrobiaceae bacterium]